MIVALKLAIPRISRGLVRVMSVVFAISAMSPSTSDSGKSAAAQRTDVGDQKGEMVRRFNEDTPGCVGAIQLERQLKTVVGRPLASDLRDGGKLDAKLRPISNIST